MLHTAARELCTQCSTWAARYHTWLLSKLTPIVVVFSILSFLLYTEQLLLPAGGCTWQWLHRTTNLQSSDHELDGDAHPAKMSTHAESPHQKLSHVRAAAISSRHAKQTKRLLRLFRHALTKQSSATQPDSGITRSDPAAQSSQTASLSAASALSTTSALTATSAPPVPGLASADPAAAVDPLTSAADGPAPTAAPAQHSAALPSEAEAHPQTVCLVETSIPWEVANFSACQVPCVFSVSVPLYAVPAQLLQSSEADAPGSLENQKLAAEKLVAQALKQAFQGCKLHCSSSIKVLPREPFMQNLMQRTCLKMGAVQVKTVQSACNYTEDGSMFAKVLDQSSLPGCTELPTHLRVHTFLDQAPSTALLIGLRS